MLYYTGLTILGILSFILLFYKIPVVGRAASNGCLKVSVIIPVRNEENNIKGLLTDLVAQKYPLYEIICIDDDSSDNSGNIINSFNEVTLLKPRKENSYMNKKAVACQLGAATATGDLLLFLDADVRLADDAVNIIVREHEVAQHTISVQPYHDLQKPYENLSYFFNLVQLAANGCCSMIKLKKAGLYGPVIAINRKLYNKIGGHSCAYNSIVDDMELGRQLTKKGYGYSVFSGGKHISFRMYPDGIKSLKEGWEKNISTGAGYTSPTLFILTFLWLTGCSSCVVMLFEAVTNINSLIAGLFFYLYWVFSMHIVASKVGRFKVYASFLYPVWFLGFCYIFVLSTVKRILHIPASWRGRKIRWG